MTAEQLISKLDLQPHPEGGYFKETYRSEGSIAKDGLGKAYNGPRNYSTSIYFLLTSDKFSAFHRINQDEIWHFYKGTALLLLMISPKGEHSKHLIGNDLEKGEVPQFVVPGGYWFAAKVIAAHSYSFVGCTVAPGFSFDDFELMGREELTALFPKHAAIIKSLTHH